MCEIIIVLLPISPQKKVIWLEYPHFMPCIISHKLVFQGIICTEDYPMSSNGYLWINCAVYIFHQHIVYGNLMNWRNKTKGFIRKQNLRILDRCDNEANTV